MASTGVVILYPDAETEITVQPDGSTSYTRYTYMDFRVTDGEVYYLHREQLSSLRAVTDASGNQVEAGRYAAFGEPSNKTLVTSRSIFCRNSGRKTGSHFCWNCLYQRAP